MQPPRLRLVLLLAAAAMLFSAGCAEIGQPYLGEGVGAPPTTIETEDPENLPEEEEIVSANVSAVYSPPRPDGYVPGLLASLGSTLVLVEDDVITELGDRFPGPPVERIADDFLGGLVAQLEGDIIQWLPADGAAPTLISQANGSLLDVGFVDDTLAVQAFLEVPGGVDRVKLVDGEREPFTRFDEGVFVVAFSSSNGIQAVAIGDAACGALAFFNTSGQRIDLGGPSDPECPVPRRPHFGAVAMSPGGDVVAFTEVEYRDDGLPASTALIVLELESGRVLLAEEVGTPGEQIESLSYDGRRIAFLRTGETGRQVGLVIVAEKAESVIEGLPGVQDVSFARLPLLLADPELDSEGEAPAEGVVDEPVEN